jgi:putative Holliday junction resolvase
MRILAVDWGERRIGLAVSDPSGTLASPLATRVVRGPEDALEQVAKVAASEEAERIVVGLPLLLSGERGEAAIAAESFAARLAERTAIPVETYDERLTSALGERLLRESGTRRKRDKGQLDQSAAVMLLDSFLRRLANRRREEP